MSQEVGGWSPKKCGNGWKRLRSEGCFYKERREQPIKVGGKDGDPGWVEKVIRT